MFNIKNKNLIFFSFGLLAIFFFALVLMPKNTNAEVCRVGWEGNKYVGYCNNNISNQNYNNYNSNDYYYNIASSAYSTPANNQNISKTSDISETKKTSVSSTTNTTANGSDEQNKNQVKNLAAGVIFGYNGFLPSSIFQWIFFTILILLAIILWRKLYVSEEDKHTPLKHA